MALSFKSGWSAFRLFDEMLGGQPFFFPFQAQSGVLSPQLDVICNESTEEYLVNLEMPGIHEGGLTVSFQEGELEVRGASSISRELKYFRQITVPDGVDPRKITASYHDNKLVIVVPFPTEADKIRSSFQIPVSRL